MLVLPGNLPACMLTAPDEISRIEGRPLPLAATVFRDGTRLTRPWTRQSYHGYVPAMTGHLIGAYHGRAQDCCWILENKRLSARLRPGMVTVLPEQHDGHWELPGTLDVAHVYLANERLQMCAAPLTKGRRIELIPCVGPEDATAATILALIAREVLSNDAGSNLFIEQALDLLCLQLARSHSSATVQTPFTASRGLTRWQVRLVTSYMLEHLDEDITLAQLASLLNLNRYHFCRSFRLATGYAPHAWLTTQRMQRARVLLSDPTLHITDIALTVGYQTASAFTAKFRRTVGMTPTEFRRRL